VYARATGPFSPWRTLLLQASKDKVKVVVCDSADPLDLRKKDVAEWSKAKARGKPAVLILTESQFQILSTRGRKKKELLDPGPDIMILDEGHSISNPNTVCSHPSPNPNTACSHTSPNPNTVC
jgi:hypothetical protein